MKECSPAQSKQGKSESGESDTLVVTTKHSSPRAVKMGLKVVQQEDDPDDCLFIAEPEESSSAEEEEKEEDVICSPKTTEHIQDQSSKRDSINGLNHLPAVNQKFHNLPIHELKKKLAFCSMCNVQYVNHKQANLCLSKHGKRQCWLCLDVIPNTKDSYLQHCVRVHKIDQNNDIVACPYCLKNFDFRQGFNQHVVKVHFSEDTSYVKNTACLSPNSLVTLYTGQPRPGHSPQLLAPTVTVTATSQTNDSENSRPNVTTTCSNAVLNGGDNMYPKNGGQYTSTSALTITPTLPNSVFPQNRDTFQEDLMREVSKAKFNYKNISLQVDVDKVVERKHVAGVTRESVIRETPQSNLTFTEMYGMSQNPFPPGLHHNQPPFIDEVTSDSGVAVCYNHKLVSGGFTLPHYPHHPTTNSYRSQRHYHSNMEHHQHQIRQTPLGDGRCATPRIHPTIPQHLMMESPQSCTKGYYQRQTHTPAPQQSYYNGHNGTSHHFPRLGHLNMGPPPAHAVQRHQYPPVDRAPIPSSPSLLEMERLVHSTPEQNQYINSVNSMLQTVAKFNPAPVSPQISDHDFLYPAKICAVPSPFEHSHEMNTARTPCVAAAPFLSPCKKAAVHPNPELLPDTNTFKVPTHAGIKRRILNKWDEHQETKKIENLSPTSPHIVPAPTISEMDYNQAQVEIHTGVNPSSVEQSYPTESPFPNQNNNSVDNNGNGFWEKVLRESNAMYRTMNLVLEHSAQMQNNAEPPTSPVSTNSYPSNNFVQHYAPHRIRCNGLRQQFHPQLSPNSGQNVYTNLIARVDARSGRPFGVYTADGQRCKVSSVNPPEQPQLLTATGVDQNNYPQDMINSHLQYQHRIIRQATLDNYSNSPDYSLQSTPGNYRKRKSSVPIRVVPTPNPTSDSVVVQNPFEEEDSSPFNRNRPTSKEFQKVSPPVCLNSYAPSPPPLVNNNYRKMQLKKFKDYSQQILRTKQHDQFMNCHPNFTSGGQIADVSGRSTPNFLSATRAVPMDTTRVSLDSPQTPQGDISGQIHCNNSQNMNPNPLSPWPPFVVAHRYSETTQKIMAKLNVMGKERQQGQSETSLPNGTHH